VELLRVENLSKTYPTGFFGSRKVEALKGVTFALDEEPSVLGVVGESGSGKSTLAKIILALIKPSAGRVYYKGKEVFSLKRAEIATYRKEVQPVFQDPYSIYNPFYRVDRFLELPLKSLMGIHSKEEREALVVEALNSVGLRPNDVLGRYPHQLSGGERQRIMLARIILLKPRLLIADEPVSMLDVSLTAIFLTKILQLKRLQHMSTIFITHDLSVAHYVCDRLIVLRQGLIVEEGPADSVVRAPQHPYTKALVESMPIADPRKGWKHQEGNA